MQLPAGHQLNQLRDIDEQVINPKDFYKDKSLEEIRAMGTQSHQKNAP